MDVSLQYDPTVFKHRYKLSLIPIDKRTTKGINRAMPNMRTHVTTYGHANRILKSGITPEEDARCMVLGSKILPQLGLDDLELELAIRECKDRGVYVWDEPNESVRQVLATVGIVQEDNPAILVVDMEDLDTDYDPAWKVDSVEDPMAYVHKGTIDPDRIECICHLRDDLIPDVGAIMCPVVHPNPDKHCPVIDSTDPDLYHDLHDIDNWVCMCKDQKVHDEIVDRVMEEATNGNSL